MTIPNLNVPVNSDQASCLDLIPAHQLAVEPLCSWRLHYIPRLELKVFNDREQLRYSMYNHHPSIKQYWTNSAFSSEHLASAFTHCVWKGVTRSIESRLFSDGQVAVFVSVDLNQKILAVKEWDKGNVHDFLITHNPLISAVHEDHSLELQEEIREMPRSRPYDPKAEEGMMRWHRTPKGELTLVEGEPVTEETIRVWPGFPDLRLIKYVDKQREEILFRAFDWEKKKNLEVSSRLASCARTHLFSRFDPCEGFYLLSSGFHADANTDVDTLIQKIQQYTPTLENVKNKEIITIYREHPLEYFMPDYVLSRTKAEEVQRWVYEQFYRKEGETKKPFEYSNFISANKISFVFKKEKKEQQRVVENPPEIEAWHVEMKRQAAWALQFPVGMSHFFSGIFSQPPIVDTEAMKRLVQGVPLFDPERNQAVDDFAVELGACSTIHFYMACDRSKSQLEINGRVWVRNFAHAGRSVGGAAEALAHAFGRVNIAEANRALTTTMDVIESANRLRQRVQALRRGDPFLKIIPENDEKG